MENAVGLSKAPSRALVSQGLDMNIDQIECGGKYFNRRAGRGCVCGNMITECAPSTEAIECDILSHFGLQTRCDIGKIERTQSAEKASVTAIAIAEGTLRPVFLTLPSRCREVNLPTFECPVINIGL